MWFSVLSCLIVLLFLTVLPLQGEVEEVMISWNSELCTANCIKLVQERFEKTKEIDSFQVSASQGIARIQWKPNVKFSYVAVKRVLQSVGVGLDDIRVRVRGTVKDEGKQVALYSEGDRTRFVLVSPLLSNPGEPNVPANPALMSLTPHLKETILEDAQQGKIFVIEGALYRPWNTPYLMIVIERLQVEKRTPPHKRG